jgi:hypothetical protein
MTEHKSFKRLGEWPRRVRRAVGARALAERRSGSGADRDQAEVGPLRLGRPRHRVHVTFLAKADARSTVALEHRRLPDAGQADRMKSYWRRRLTALKHLLEQ